MIFNKCQYKYILCHTKIVAFRKILVFSVFLFYKIV